MVTAKEIDRQLKNIGVSFWFLGNAELRELRYILVEGEVIDHCILGRYDGGFAVLCSTNLRLLLIDKKPFYLTLEDIRYDMIVEVDFAYRLFQATVTVCTPNKTLAFRSTNKAALRLMSTYVQQRVLAYRQQHMGQQAELMPMQYQAAPLKPAWQPELLIAEKPSPSPHHSMKNMAHTAIGGASHLIEDQPVNSMRQAINPYARSSFTTHQRTSRF